VGKKPQSAVRKGQASGIIKVRADAKSTTDQTARTTAAEG
jgi:hypothetical protein